MTSKRDFSSSEWKQIINAPQHIYHAFIAGETTSIFQKRSEAKALTNFLDGFSSSSVLVKSIIADQDEADDDVKGKYADSISALEEVGSLLHKKAPDSDGDGVRRLLTGAAESVAEATIEFTSLRSRDVVSKKEVEIIAEIEDALMATADDARARRAAVARREAAKPSSSRAKAASRSSADDDAAEMARRQREVEERAAARRAKKEKEVMSASEIARRQRDVEERAAARRAEREAEEQATKMARRETAQKAALERKEAREAKERAAKRAEAHRRTKESRARAAEEAREAEKMAKKAAKHRIKAVQRANPEESGSKVRIANRAISKALKDVRKAKSDREREYHIDEVYELLDEYGNVIPEKREKLIVDRLNRYEKGAVEDGDEDEEVAVRAVNTQLVKDTRKEVASALYQANVHRWTDIYVSPAGDPLPGALSPDTMVNVLSENPQGGWVEVHADGGSVWIPKDAVTAVRPAVASTPATAKSETAVVGRWTDVYDGPGGNKVSGVCSPDMAVNIVEWGPKRNWIRINAQGMDVWIPADSLK